MVCVAGQIDFSLFFLVLFHLFEKFLLFCAFFYTVRCFLCLFRNSLLLLIFLFFLFLFFATFR